MNKEIEYKSKLSENLTVKEKEEFIQVFNNSFHTDFNMDWFNWKYTENIYGNSYIILAYNDSKLVGIRSFWRNDIDGEKCYQPCDTAVLEEYRGEGLFTEMTLKALGKVPKGLIYNFPNDNSLPGNLKLGWKINKYYYLKFVFNRFKLNKDTEYIPDDYLLWKFAGSPLRKYHYYEKNGEAYLLFERINGVYYILGRFNSEYSNYFTKVKPKLLLNYTDKKTLLYRMVKNRGTIVSNSREEDYSHIDIPIFRGDFF